QNAGLKVADLVAKPFPGLPRAFKRFHAFSLEQGVNERCNGRALGQHDEGADQKQADDHGNKPPSLLAPEKRHQLACNAKIPCRVPNPLHCLLLLFVSTEIMSKSYQLTAATACWPASGGSIWCCSSF